MRIPPLIANGDCTLTNPKYAVLANVILASGDTTYRAKIIETPFPPEHMDYPSLTRAFAQEGPNVFSWSLHPDSFGNLSAASHHLAGLKEKAAIEEATVHLEVDVSARTVRVVMPL